MPQQQQFVCQQCGTPFERPPSRGTVPKYCSARCRRVTNGRRGEVRPAQRPCDQCGKSFPVRSAGGVPQRFCSLRCKYDATNQSRRSERPGLAERFWSHVDRSGGPDAHWLWTGGRKGSAGAFRVGGRSENGGFTITAHRVAFALANDLPIEAVGAVRQTCGERLCQNPAHLTDKAPTDAPPTPKPEQTPSLSIEQRIAALVDRDELGHDIWQGSIDRNDYPVMWLGRDQPRKQGLVGRLRWEANKGPIPDGYVVTAGCRERFCVALDHLVCEPREVINSRQMSHLTDDDVRTIRAAYEGGEQSQTALAKQYQISQRTISNLVNRKSFKHVA